MEASYLYSPNFIITIVVPVLLVITLASPRKFMWLVILITLLRPNERFDLPFSFPLIVIPLSFIVLLLFIKKENLLDSVNVFKFPESKIIIILSMFILLQTVLFHRENLYNNSLQIFSGLVFYFNIILFFGNEKYHKELYILFITATALICFEPLYYHFTEDVGSRIWLIFNNYQGRIKAWGVWNNANETSFLAILGITNTLLLGAVSKKNSTVFLLIIIAFLTLVIIMTGSRTGLACLFILFGLRGLFSRGGVKPKVLMIVITLGVLFALPYYAPERHDQQASTSERSDLRYRGIQLFEDYPMIGVGFNRARMDTGGMLIHCTYVQAFAELGLVGGGLFLFYIYRVVSSIYTKWLYCKNEKIIQPYLGTLFGFTAASLFYLFFGNQLLTPIFYCVMAIIIVSRSVSKITVDIEKLNE